MVIIAGLARIRAEVREEAMRVGNGMADLSRQEQGCLAYRVGISADDPNAFFLYEEWESEAALDAHFHALHTREFTSRLGGYHELPTGIQFYRRYIVTPADSAAETP
jgi:quinol monooxygenase YgiN